MNAELMTPTVQIASAFLMSNPIDADKVPAFVQSVYDGLATLGADPTPEFVPAMDAKKAIKPDSITCLECGAKMKMLKRHLMTEHGITPAEYRTRYNLAADYPMVAPNYADKRRELAKAIGLGRKPGQRRGRLPKARSKT